MPDSWSDVPMITCPHCGEEFQLDDYYNLGVGDTFDCTKCEKEIHILQVATILSFCLGTNGEGT